MRRPASQQATRGDLPEVYGAGLPATRTIHRIRRACHRDYWLRCIAPLKHSVLQGRQIPCAVHAWLCVSARSRPWRYTEVCVSQTAEWHLSEQPSTLCQAQKCRAPFAAWAAIKYSCPRRENALGPDALSLNDARCVPVSTSLQQKWLHHKPCQATTHANMDLTQAPIFHSAGRRRRQTTFRAETHQAPTTLPVRVDMSAIC